MNALWRKWHLNIHMSEVERRQVQLVPKPQNHFQVIHKPTVRVYLSLRHV